MISASSSHTAMTPKQRCSNAMTGDILLDLCQMTQGTMAERCGQTAESTFLHPVTVRNLQQLAGSAVIMCLPGAAGLHIRRSRLCDFSLLRRQFANAAMTARGYVQASARQMRRHLQDLKRTQQDAKGEPEQLEALTFRAVAQHCARLLCHLQRPDKGLPHKVVLFLAVVVQIRACFLVYWAVVVRTWLRSFPVLGSSGTRLQQHVHGAGESRG